MSLDNIAAMSVWICCKTKTNWLLISTEDALRPGFPPPRLSLPPDPPPPEWPGEPPTPEVVEFREFVLGSLGAGKSK